MNIVLGEKLFARRRLRRPLPVRVEDLLKRAEVRCWIAMAIQAPAHVQTGALPGQRHAVDRAVAGDTSDTFGNMNAVIEICELGQVVNTFPLDRLVIAKTGSDGFEIWTVRPQLAVTVHTSLRRRHARGSGGLDRLVTISAVDTVVAYMVFMRELYGLLLFQVSSGQVRGAGYLCIRIKGSSGKHDRGHHAYPGDVVRTFIKKLCHPQYSPRNVPQESGRLAPLTRRSRAGVK